MILELTRLLIQGHACEESGKDTLCLIKPNQEAKGRGCVIVSKRLRLPSTTLKCNPGGLKPNWKPTAFPKSRVLRAFNLWSVMVYLVTGINFQRFTLSSIFPLC